MAKIVIAEDERDIRELVTFTLQFAGHQVIATSNGEEAVEATLRERPDLVIMDVRMPRMTGYEASRRLKTMPETKDIPVVFLSAKGQDAEVQEGYEAGAVAYILKPFSPDGLIQQVTKILSQYGKV